MYTFAGTVLKACCVGDIADACACARGYGFDERDGACDSRQRMRFSRIFRGIGFIGFAMMNCHVFIFSIHVGACIPLDRVND